ncbi:MAG: hypothetical protein ACRC7G_11640, partial [Beijerinckiaceae bacterium]
DCRLAIADMADARLPLTDRLIDAALGRPETPNPKALKGEKAKPKKQDAKPASTKPEGRAKKPDRRKQQPVD